MNTTTEQSLANIEQLLLASKRILSVKELSRYTGWSPSFIYKLIAGRKIPFSKPNGKLIYFDRLKIDEILLSNSSERFDDVEQEAIDYVNNRPWKGGSV